MSRLARERWRLASLDEARSMLWVLRQLTSKKAASDIAAGSYLYELHQLASKGMAAVESVIGDIELSLKYEKQL